MIECPTIYFVSNKPKVYSPRSTFADGVEMQMPQKRLQTHQQHGATSETRLAFNICCANRNQLDVTADTYFAQEFH